MRQYPRLSLSIGHPTAVEKPQTAKKNSSSRLRSGCVQRLANSVERYRLLRRATYPDCPKPHTRNEFGPLRAFGGSGSVVVGSGDFFEAVSHAAQGGESFGAQFAA